MMWLLLASAGALGLVLLAALFYYACSVPSSQVLGPTLVWGPAAGGGVALTCDDGPARPFTEQILDILRDYNVPATCFVCGKHVERSDDIMRLIHSERQSIRNQ